jgi:hypothetical protein
MHSAAETLCEDPIAIVDYRSKGAHQLPPYGDHPRWCTDRRGGAMAGDKADCAHELRLPKSLGATTRGKQGEKLGETLTRY